MSTSKRQLPEADFQDIQKRLERLGSDVDVMEKCTMLPAPTDRLECLLCALKFAEEERDYLKALLEIPGMDQYHCLDAIHRIKETIRLSKLSLEQGFEREHS